MYIYLNESYSLKLFLKPIFLKFETLILGLTLMKKIGGNS